LCVPVADVAGHPFCQLTLQLTPACDTIRSHQQIWASPARAARDDARPPPPPLPHRPSIDRSGSPPAAEAAAALEFPTASGAK